MHHIGKRLGWCPGSSTRETAYDHLNVTIADEHKYALHVLLVEHGKRCRLCSKGGRLQKEVEGDCPFKNWSSTVQEYSSSSSTEETSNRIEKVTIKEEKIVFETPTAFYRNEKRKEEDVSSSNEKAVKRLRHWDLQNASYVANESKQ